MAAGLSFGHIRGFLLSSSLSLRGAVLGAGADGEGPSVLHACMCVSPALPEMTVSPLTLWLDPSHPALLMQLCQPPYLALSFMPASNNLSPPPWPSPWSSLRDPSPGPNQPPPWPPNVSLCPLHPALPQWPEGAW